MKAAEKEIRALLDERLDAIRAKDAARAIATLAEDVVAFELAPPLSVGADEVRDPDRFAAWLGSFEKIDIEARHLRIDAGETVGFASALHHLTGTRIDGRSVSMWMRSTLGLRRDPDGWKIAHAHTSVPFYMDGSFRAAVNLRPWRPRPKAAPQAPKSRRSRERG